MVRGSHVLAGRGLIREGQWADVTIFDLDQVQDLSTYEKPNVYPAGIDWVLANGTVVVDQQKHTGAKPGIALFGPGYEPVKP